MLYFSKLKLVTIYFIIVFLSLFSFANFVDDEDNILLSKKVNLGLDLQGGSYLLLEVDSQPAIKQKLQNKLLNLRKALKNEKIKYKNLRLQNETINFQLSENDIQRFDDFFLNKENSINAYYNRYRSYEMDYFTTDLGASFPTKDLVTITYSKFGLIELKDSILDDSLEIVRRRVDEVGTKEPTILRRGNDRILIELPGLDDPNRIKNLLGKTANLTFRLISEEEDDFGSELLFFEDDTTQLRVSKRVVMSGDNLTNARPRFDNLNNETVVSFTLDRVGAKKFGRVTTKNIGNLLTLLRSEQLVLILVKTLSRPELFRWS